MLYLNVISNLCARNVKNVQIYLYYRPSHLVRACPMIAKQLTQVWHDLGLVMVRPESQCSCAGPGTTLGSGVQTICSCIQQSSAWPSAGECGRETRSHLGCL